MLYYLPIGKITIKGEYAQAEGTAKTKSCNNRDSDNNDANTNPDTNPDADSDTKRTHYHVDGRSRS
jgi:hypothetical protein